MCTIVPEPAARISGTIARISRIGASGFTSTIAVTVASRETENGVAGAATPFSAAA